MATTRKYLENLTLRHFTRHIVFAEDNENYLEKQVKQYVDVIIAVDMETGDTNGVG